MKSFPKVFIIETLSEENEKDRRSDGVVLSDILRLSDRNSEYLYIRTVRELEWAVKQFVDSEFRYLHLSCHGSEDEMITTLETLSFDELGKILNPALKNRRLFLSACSMTNKKLAAAIIPKSGCFSVIGPRAPIDFADAALLWSSFYHLMFNRNPDTMKGADIHNVVTTVAKTFNVPMRYYAKDPSKPEGFSIRAIRPSGQKKFSKQSSSASHSLSNSALRWKPDQIDG